MMVNSSALPVGSVVILVSNSPPDTAGTWALGSQTLFGGDALRLGANGIMEGLNVFN